MHITLIMATKRNSGYIEKFRKKASDAIDDGVKKASVAIDDGIKKADDILDEAVEFGAMAAGQAKKTGAELHSKAKKEKDNLKKRGAKKINEGITAAKNATSNTEQDLATLEKLGKLRKAGVITEKEFQAKKKKILARI